MNQHNQEESEVSLQSLNVEYKQLQHRHDTLQNLLQRLRHEESCLQNALQVALGNDTAHGLVSTTTAAPAAAVQQQLHGNHAETRALQRLHDALFAADNDDDDDDDDESSGHDEAND